MHDRKLFLLFETESIVPLDWQRDAGCEGTDPDEFFPDKGQTTARSKEICNACPVKRLCLLTAIARDEDHGVWGGESSRDRRRIAKQMNPRIVKLEAQKAYREYKHLDASVAA